MKKSVCMLCISAIFIAGCAEKSSEISATYVSPIQYENYSCKQIRAEASRLSARASSVMGVQDKKAENDTAATAIGIVLFWPALFFIKGDSEARAEISQLKGKMNALEEVSNSKNCGIVFNKPAPEEPA